MGPAERNYWPGQASAADRRAARKNIVLENVGITEATLQRYFTAVSRMAHLLGKVTTECSLDDLVADWIQQEFEDGTPLYLVGDALSGIHHYEPFTKKKLPKSWRLYSIWRKYEVPCRAPPLTQDITLAMAGWCLQHGELTMGALILLGFHALLRTGELLSVRPCDFLLDNSTGLVSLPRSKSGLRNNSLETVSLHDPILSLKRCELLLNCEILWAMVSFLCGRRVELLLGSCSRRSLKKLHISHLSFRPYSLRRGGATWEMQSHGLMERTLIRGRWKNSNVARIYIQDGLSLLPRLTMSWDAKKSIHKYSAVFTAKHCFQWGAWKQKAKNSLNFLGEWLCFVFENWFLPWNPFGAPSMEPNKVPTMELEDENFEDES